jgi:hypothetical protein
VPYGLGAECEDLSEVRDLFNRVPEPFRGLGPLKRGYERAYLPDIFLLDAEAERDPLLSRRGSRLSASMAFDLLENGGPPLLTSLSWISATSRSGRPRPYPLRSPLFLEFPRYSQVTVWRATLKLIHDDERKQ